MESKVIELAIALVLFALAVVLGLHEAIWPHKNSKYRVVKVLAKATKEAIVIDHYFIIQWRLLFWFNYRELQGFPLENETVIFETEQQAKAKISELKNRFNKPKTEICS